MVFLNYGDLKLEKTEIYINMRIVVVPIRCTLSFCGNFSKLKRQLLLCFAKNDNNKQTNIQNESYRVDLSIYFFTMNSTFGSGINIVGRDLSLCSYGGLGLLCPGVSVHLRSSRKMVSFKN